MDELRKRQFAQKIIEKGATRVYFIQSKIIPLSWKAVMLCLDCKITNKRMMMRWSCPPYSLSPDAVKEMLERYLQALVVNLEVPLPFFVNRSWDSFDPVLQISQKLYCHFYWSKLHRIMTELKTYFQQSSIPGYVWGSSPCHACFKCSYPFKCRKPGRALISPEASGIDLYRLAGEIGIPLEIPPRKKVQLMSIALF